MNILLIGQGGREHALAWKISQSPLLNTLYITKGNGGMGDCGTLIDIAAENHAEIINFCKANDIALVIIGPEAPLVSGLADDLQTAEIPCFGPSKNAAQLEGSKGFTKDICREYSIPTAKYERFTEAKSAKDYVLKEGAPIVIKADGLAAGKGVIMAETIEQANAAIDEIFNGAFGEAGAEIVIEETLVGEEASFFVITDGETCLPLATAQDHKRAYEGDEGPNTGGMGAYSPAPIMTDELIETTMKTIIEPTVKAMNDKGMTFKGVLFAGLMITEKGPELIEYNVRFGDPECQVLMMRLKSDIVPALLASANKTLDQITLDWRRETALTVVMAAKGYPAKYEKGTEIKGLNELSQIEDLEIFHAGTIKQGDTILANGGRVLNVTGLGKTVMEAQQKAYAALSQITWKEGFYRKDIGWRAINQQNSKG